MPPVQAPMQDGDDIQTLIGLMARLPGLGPRSARRIVLHLIAARDDRLARLSQAIDAVAHNARECIRCGNISGSELCPICADPRRLNGEICVVEDVADLWAIERGGGFRGTYHVLGGTLSALDEITPEDLRIPALLARIPEEAAREVILALPATVEGQATAHYIADALAGVEGVAVTSLAQGVPVGGDLDYLDDGTIQTALRARRRF